MKKERKKEGKCRIFRFLSLVLCVSMAASLLVGYGPREVSGEDAGIEELSEFTQVIFEDDFSDPSISNELWTSSPTLDQGVYRLELGLHAGLKDLNLTSALIEADVKVENGGDWIGLLFNKTNMEDIWATSGNMLYIRNTGKADLMCAGAVTDSDVSVPGYSPENYVNVKLLTDQGTVKVYLNNEKVIDTKVSCYTSGLASFFVSGSRGNGCIDNVSVKVRPTEAEEKEAEAEDIAFAQNLEYGIFLHYIWGGKGSATIDENGDQPDNIHDFVNHFDVEQVVEDCKEMGVQYVIFTAWHYRMNPLYYSEVYREWRADAEVNNPSLEDADIIMELADGLAECGIDLLLYTHPNDLHDFSDADKATFDYKYRGDTSFDYEKWNDYLNAQYEEVTTRYKGKIKGFFLDEGLGYPTNASFVDYNRLRRTIKKIDSGMIMIQNWSEVSGSGSYQCDTGMVEDRIQTSWGSGDWGDSLGTSITDGDTWPSFGISFAARVGERPFNWSAQYTKEGLFTGSDTEEFQTKEMVLASAEDIFRYTIYQAASNYGGMGCSWAFGPYSGLNNTDIWEPGIKSLFVKVGDMLGTIKDSVFATKPSASWPAKVDVSTSNPRVKTGCLGEVTYVAMSSADGSREFVHVLNPGVGSAISGQTLTLPKPADERSYNTAQLVADGTKLDLKVNADGSISITLPEGVLWEENDTAIELSFTEEEKEDTTAEDIAHFLDDKYGLFVHYVWAGQRRIGAGGQAEEISARYPDGTKAQTIDEMIENFDAEQFAQDCQDMGMQYVIFTVWHYGMNPLYPSEVYKEWRTHEEGDLPSDDGQHDLIDKVYQELNKKGISLYLYTHPYDIHDLYPEDQAAFDYKYAGDLTFDHEKWNAYLNAQYQELCQRYKGKIKGMFLDEGLANPANNLSVDYPRLRETVKSVDSSLVMIQNEYNGKYSCDTSMWELPTAWHGGSYNNLESWQTNTIPIGTSIGNIYQGYSWWAIKNRGTGADGIETAENAYIYTVLQAASNTEGGGICWAAGPYCGDCETYGGTSATGIWEDGIKETLVKLYDYMKPVEGSIKSSRPSSSYGTPAYATYASIEWGVATESKDGNITYLHVMKPQEGSRSITIDLPQDNKVFSKARLLATGEEVSLEQTASGLTLTLPEGTSWDPLNTVIELSTDAKSHLETMIRYGETTLNNDHPWLYQESAEIALKERLEAAKEVLEAEGASEEELEQAAADVQNAREDYENAWIQDSIAGENYALGKAVTASTSLENGQFSASYVTDGHRLDGANRGWTSDPHATSPWQMEWIQIDLGQVQRVGRVDLTPSNESGYAFPKDFYIEVSEDGNNYTKVYEAVNYGSDGSVYQAHFAATGARYVRITGSKQSPDQANGQSHRMQFGEIEVFPMSVEEAAYKVSKTPDIAADSMKLQFPALAEGFAVQAISYSSDPNVIALDGTIDQSEEAVDVGIRYAIAREADQALCETRTVLVNVPGRIPAEERSEDKEGDDKESTDQKTDDKGSDGREEVDQETGEDSGENQESPDQGTGDRTEGNPGSTDKRSENQESSGIEPREDGSGARKTEGGKKKPSLVPTGDTANWLGYTALLLAGGGLLAGGIIVRRKKLK